MDKLEPVAKPSGFAGNAGIRPRFSVTCRRDACAPGGFAIDSLIPELLEIVRGEISLYHDLLECERRKTALLAAGRVEELMECNKAGESSVACIQELEAKRLHICGKLCGELRVAEEEFTLVSLVKLLDNPLDLGKYAALLRDAIKSVQTVGARNRSLIDRSLRYAEGMLAIFSNAAGPYQPNGTFSMEASVLPTFSQNA